MKNPEQATDDDLIFFCRGTGLGPTVYDSSENTCRVGPFDPHKNTLKSQCFSPSMRLVVCLAYSSFIILFTNVVLFNFLSMSRIELNTFSRSTTPVSLPPPVITCARGQVLTVLISPGHYSIRSISPRDCHGEPNFLLEVTQDVFNLICNERDNILSRYFTDCRSDYTFGFKMDNNQLEGAASIQVNKIPGHRVTVRFYNCELTQATVEGIRRSPNYIKDVGGYLMFHIIHWKPKSLLKNNAPLPLYRYKFMEGRFFKDPEEWELFLHQQRLLRQQETDACEDPEPIQLGSIVF